MKQKAEKDGIYISLYSINRSINQFFSSEIRQELDT